MIDSRQFTIAANYRKSRDVLGVGGVSAPLIDPNGNSPMRGKNVRHEFDQFKVSTSSDDIGSAIICINETVELCQTLKVLS